MFDWKELLLDKMSFASPNLVNGSKVLNLEENFNLKKLPYVYIDIVKPGNHFYNVLHENSLFTHRFLARSRDEPVPAVESKK